MKQAIGGRLYDTEKVDLVTSNYYWDGSNWGRKGRNAYLYKMANWLVSCLVVLLLTLIITGCGVSPEREAEMQALGFLERITGARFFSDNLDIAKTITGPHEVAGLEEGESRWRIEGTVAHGVTRNKYTVRIFVDEIDSGERWRLVGILKGPGINVPVGRLEEIHP